jgi:hypothetical protein
VAEKHAHRGRWEPCFFREAVVDKTTIHLVLLSSMFFVFLVTILPGAFVTFSGMMKQTFSDLSARAFLISGKEFALFVISGFKYQFTGQPD